MIPLPFAAALFQLVIWQRLNLWGRGGGAVKFTTKKHRSRSNADFQKAWRMTFVVVVSDLWFNIAAEC